MKLLQSFDIKILSDIRSFPGSKRFPHFNKAALQQALPASGISYRHDLSLGGRRKALKDSKNLAWKNESFRGYADYMETVEFKNAVSALEQPAGEYRLAYMCSEALWWRCHRALLSDYLKWKGWDVFHITGEGKYVVHPYTSAAQIIQGELSYAEKDILF